MSDRKNWSDDDLLKIWNYSHGNNNQGYCPKVGCPYPNTPMKWSNYGNHSDTSWVVDHIIPIDKNGSNSLSNLQPMHNYCNSKKSNNYY